jgi:RNA polymerase sigma-70 factor (ECF subfamily)
VKPGLREAALDAVSTACAVNEEGEGASKARDVQAAADTAAAGAPSAARSRRARSVEREQDREVDRALVERARGGDESAFRALYERYHRRLYVVALGVVKNRQDALDVVQEAFIKVHKHLDGFQGTSSFYTWLYRILMNLAIDHVRKHPRTRDVDYDDRVGRDSAAAEENGVVLPRVSDGDPGKMASRRELHAKLHAALAELPEYHRAVILLREVDGLSYEEMAQTLGVPKGTIMSRLFHARRKMQLALAGYVEGELTPKDAAESGDE